MARDLADTEAFQVARARRKKIEMLFAHLKRHLKIMKQPMYQLKRLK